MRKVGILAVFILWMSVGILGAEEKIVVGGGAGLFGQVKEMAKLYQAKNPSQQIEIMAESIPTTASIEATKAGRLTVGLVGRPPRDDERGRLLYREIARVPIGAGVHKSSPISNLSESRICDIFSGGVKSWSDVGGGDGKIMVLTVIQKNDIFTPTIRNQMACFRDLKINPDAIVLSRQLELMDAINHRLGTVGIISVAANMNDIRPNLKAVAVSGVVPSAETVQSGKYNYFNEYGVITLGEPQGVAKHFLEFMTGSEGRKILLRDGLTPVR